MKKVKIDKTDKQIYYPMSFNEQMAWIDEIVEICYRVNLINSLIKFRKWEKKHIALIHLLTDCIDYLRL